MDQSDQLPSPLISLRSPITDIKLVRGKGANLIKLAHAGFPVPDGFLIPTIAYQNFIKENQLGSTIFEILEKYNLSSPDELESASKEIRDNFSGGNIPKSLGEAIKIGWQVLGEGHVAVRSSATAEDLPEMSFAGQQDTYLNVFGIEQILASVINCWSSLWTARAIGYRTRNDISHENVSLSVVVQNMVQSESSGILFTANPLTGLRNQFVIDATLGLGETLVSGQVEPDHYIVDSQDFTIKQKSLGSKALIISGKSGGGVTSREFVSSHVQALPDSKILQITEMGKQIEQLLGYPQDIEWALEGSNLHILQSRPITSLFPLPEVSDTEQLHVYFSFGAVQGILEPMTPLGHDAIRLIFAGGASLFGSNDQNQHSQPVIKIAGERLWGDVTGVIRHPIGSKLILKVFPGIEPGSIEALKEILSDPEIGAGSGNLKLRTFGRLMHFISRMIRRIIFFSHNPEEKAQLIRQNYQNQIINLQEKYGDPANNQLSLDENLNLFREIYHAFIYAVPEIAAGAIPGLVPLLFLSNIAKKLFGSNDLALEITRGLPNNVTTEMDLELWKLTKAIRSDMASFELFTYNSAESLAKSYIKDDLPENAQSELRKFLDSYGMRGLGEIDIGHPRWRENPSPIIKTIQSYLKIEDESNAPDVVFQRGEKQAQMAIDQLMEASRITFGGKVKAKLIKSAARRVRSLGGLRESPKFYIIQMMGVMRQSLLNSGNELVKRDILTKTDDLFFLYLDELDALSKGEDRNRKSLIQQRRENYDREKLRRQIPRLLVSDGRTFYEGMSAKNQADGTFKGSPVSPGVVEGVIRVVFDPHNANLLPGEILVCQATDPAWTPLFLAAGGLLMEVGGLMTHGAIVAREYGIPAVVGIDAVTTRLKTGERIRLNGSNGLIEIIKK